MKNFPLLFCLVLIFASSVFAQNNKPSDCPTLDVSGGGVVGFDEPLTFTASVSNYDLSKLTFNWVVSSGEIIEGQGTPTIKVLREKNDGKNITAMVEVKIPSSSCVLADSETGAVCACPVPMLFDEFAALNNGDMKARLQNLYVELSNNSSGAQGYIINYGTDREIARREKQIRDGFTFLNLDASRITLVNGGTNPRGKGVWTKVWIVPADADNPTPDM